MSIATSTRLTPGDVLKLPKNGPIYELVDGELVEVNVSKESSRVAGRAIYYLTRYSETVQPGWVFGIDAGFVCFADDPGRLRKPDAAYISLARLPADKYEPDGYCETVPDLVVEVVSPNDIARAVAEKRDEWLATDVHTIWILEPDRQTVHVHHRNGGYAFLRAADTLTAPDLLPGFSVPVADLFRMPGLVA